MTVEALLPIIVALPPLPVIRRYAAQIGSDLFIQHVFSMTCVIIGQAEIGSAADFVGWIRCTPETLAVLAADDFCDFLGLELEQLQRGPMFYLLTVTAETPGWLVPTIRRLTRQPGLTHGVGLRIGRGRRDRAIRQAA